MADGGTGGREERTGSTGLSYVVAMATEFGACVLESMPTFASLRASPHVHGGGHKWFTLEVSSDNGRLSVRERTVARRLPPACPLRHLNSDGKFCLGWQHEDPSFVLDEAGARNWWEALTVFLGHQLHADACRRWPTGQERAHGDAAEDEAIAEGVAEGFGRGLLAGMRVGRLGLRRVARSTRLERNGRRLFALRDGSQAVSNLKAACPCARSAGTIALKACGDHASDAARLIRAMASWQEKEAQFYREFASVMPCCGTMETCPIQHSQAAHQSV